MNSANTTKAYLLALGLSASAAGSANAACCTPDQYYNWKRALAQVQVIQQHQIRQQQRVCRNIAQSGRVKLPSACLTR